MAKMKTPTLEEVKEYFKDAKKVSDAYNGLKFNLNKYDLDGIHYGDMSSTTSDIYIYKIGSKKYEKSLWDDEKGYAKILSYKEPKEKTYKITREQIVEIHKNSSCNSKYDIEQLFPEVFETKLTVGKWYKSLEHPKQIIFASDIKDVQHIKGYGFNTRGQWESCDDRFSWGLPTDGSYIEAPEQEVTEALTKEARRRGFKQGVYFKIGGVTYSSIYSDEIEVINNCVYLNGGVVLEDDQWAEIIPTITIQEAEAKLKEIGVNAKIV